jgi:transaldolase
LEEEAMNERLRKLQEIGQSAWIDSISRDDLENGNLQRLIEEGVVGVTSNPTIFQKAISGSSLYDDQLQELSEMEDDPRRSSSVSPAMISEMPAT